MLIKQEILDFNKIFETENSEEYLKRISDIPKELLIDASTFLLSFNPGSSFIKNHTELLSKWFGKENNQLANEINDKINNYNKEGSKEVGIINPRTSLTLFEKVLASNNEATEINNSNFEILLFKVYLALNQQHNINDNLVIKTANKFEDYPKLFCLSIGYSLPIFDITNFNIHTVFISQVLKAIFLLEFLDNRKDTEKLLGVFYAKFEVNDYKEFLSKMLPIAFNVISAKKEGNIDLKVNHDDNFDSNITFLDKLTVNNVDANENDVDYLNLRANPLYKISDDTYRIIYPLFAIEKIFNGLYFLLKEVNDNLPQNDKVNLRQIITYDFSEKHMLYQLIERSFKKKYLKLSGEKMTTPGAPDYYIRNGNKIFLFESKDILISAKTKESYNFVKYEAALRDKLYFHLDGKKESPKAVKQLANFAKSLLNNSFTEDKSYKPNSVKIYPIILLHNRQLDIIGLNNLVNLWFKAETELMKKESLKVQNLRTPTIINIDTLLLIHEQLASGEIKLEVILDEYQNWIDEERLKKKKFKDKKELHDAIQGQLVSFNMYFLNKYRWKLPGLFREKGISLLKTPSA